MQNAKDTFYIALRDRLAVLNPARSLAIRAVTRPGIVVEETEAPVAEILSDVFTLRWAEAGAIENLPNALASLVCEVHYATAGSQGTAGLDRGRAMTEMDRELLDILQPMCAQKRCYTVTPAATMQTQVFWSEPVLGAVQVQRSRLLRVAKVGVFAFEEPGEL